MSKKSRARELAAQLDALYARLPHVECRGLCAISCGPILVTQAEADRMKAAHPERQQLRTVPVRCAYLTKHERCSVYAVRPLICRIFGVVQRMSCMHGCVPDRWLSDHEFVAIAAEVERIGGQLLRSTPAGLAPMGRAFTDIARSIREGATLPPELAEHYAALTRCTAASSSVSVRRRGQSGFRSTVAEKISREAYEFYLRSMPSDASYEQMLAWGFTIKPCDCNYDGCQGWIFTHDDPLALIRFLSAQVKAAAGKDHD